MDAARPYWTAAATGLAVGFLFLGIGLLARDPALWFAAHGRVLGAAFLLPALAGFHAVSLTTLLPPSGPRRPDGWIAGGLAAGGLIMGAAPVTGPAASVVAFGGALVLLVAGGLASRHVLAALPRPSVVDTERDPLTKGDDASLKHVKMAHIFLPIGLAMLCASLVPVGGSPLWTERLGTAALHVLLVGYGLLSLYGLGHLWVPRFSGVPAIAAGAIKGELHSTLPALILLPAGFLTGLVGLTLAGGAFAFLGFFTYMGVLGANIMRYKSVTQRVTPEFVYIPWTFAGIFWLISGVLLGLFLNVVPDVLAAQAGSLRWIHIHMSLLGGFTLLFAGWLTRIVPAARRRGPPRFGGAMKTSFFMLNGALVVGAWGHMADGPSGPGMAAALALAVMGLGLYGAAMRGFFRPAASGGGHGDAHADRGDALGSGPVDKP